VKKLSPINNLIKTISLSICISISTLYGEDIKLHLIFTNDIHGAIHQTPAWFMNPEFGPMLSGGAGAYEYVNNIREDAERSGEFVLLMDAGNLFQGTSLGTIDGGKKIIEWMNKMEYDALTPGLKDFDQGVENLTELAQLANFPFLSGNIVEKSSGNKPEWLSPIIYKQIEDVTIAIVGLTQTEIPKQTLPGNTEGLSFLPEIQTTNTMIDEAKSNGADIIIFLAHLGIPYDREDEYDALILSLEEGETPEDQIHGLNAMELAHRVEGIDVMVTGGVAKGYDHPWEDPTTHTLILQNYGNLTGIGHLELLIDKRTKKLSGYEYPTDRGMLITLMEDDIPPNKSLADQIQKWVHESEEVYKNKRPFAEKTSSISTFLEEQNIYSVPNLGKDNWLEIVTWNLEWFPAASDTTLKAAAEIIREWDVDIVALQEIKNIYMFSVLMNLLPGYGYVLSEQSSFMDQAIIYKKDVLTCLGQYEPFTFNDYYFAGRPPLMADFIWENDGLKREFSVVNLHLKCCGDGLYRRQKSLEQLHEYLKDYLMNENENIIVAGDWNDQLTDKGINQSFTAFLNDPDHFRFATMEIATDTSQASYPKWIVPSILDHILYSKGFYDEAAEGAINTLRLEDIVGGWDMYEEILSDHRPVMWSVPIRN